MNVLASVRYILKVRVQAVYDEGVRHPQRGGKPPVAASEMNDQTASDARCVEDRLGLPGLVSRTRKGRCGNEADGCRQ
jgi:hypothetical protein